MDRKGSPKKAGKLDIVVGSRVRKAREAAGLTQLELATALGVSFQQVQKYEKGASRLSVVRLIQISRRTGMNLAGLFKELEFEDGMA